MLGRDKNEVKQVRTMGSCLVPFHSFFLWEKPVGTIVLEL